MSAPHLHVVPQPDDSEIDTMVGGASTPERTSDVMSSPTPKVVSPSERLANHRADQARKLKKAKDLQKRAQEAVRIFPALLESLDAAVPDQLANKVTETTSADDLKRLTDLFSHINSQAGPLFTERKAERDRRAKLYAERAVKLAAMVVWLEANGVTPPESFTTSEGVWGPAAHLRNIHIAVVELLQLVLSVYDAEGEEFVAYNALESSDRVVIDTVWDDLVQALVLADAEAVSKLKNSKRKAVERWATGAGVPITGWKPERT